MRKAALRFIPDINRNAIPQRFMLMLALMLAASLFVQGAARAENKQQDKLSPEPCRIFVPDDFVAACYRLRVPENRAQPDGKSLDLPIVVLRALSTDGAPIKDDAVVSIPGGPGDGGWISQDQIHYWWDFIRENEWLQQRKVVLFDPRGTGLTMPRMDCPEEEKATERSLVLGRDYQQINALYDQAAKDCLARITQEGHDPTQYTSRYVAMDLHDIFVALDLPQWNVYGISYGTRIGLAYLKAYPDDIRSMVLDSVVPTYIDRAKDSAWIYHQAFTNIFDACAGSIYCKRKYGDLSRPFRTLVARLNEQPTEITVAHPYRSGTPLKVLMTGNLFITGAFYHLYSKSNIAAWPRLVYEMANGDKGALHDFTTLMVDWLIPREDFGEAMSYSFYCLEKAPFGDFSVIKNEFARYPLVSSMAETVDLGSPCRNWVSGPVNPADKDPVISTKPVLILTGRYDPVTPPIYARKVAGDLENAFIFEFPNVGHDVVDNNECSNKLVRAFLESPTGWPMDPCYGQYQELLFE